MLYFPQTLALAEYYNKVKLPPQSAIIVLHPNYMNIVKIVSEIQQDMVDDEIVYLIPQGQPHTAGILIGKDIIVCIDSRAPDQYFSLFLKSEDFKGRCTYAIVEAQISGKRRAIQRDDKNCAPLQLCIAKTLLKENSDKGLRLGEELLLNALISLRKNPELPCVNLPGEAFKYAQSNTLVDFFINTGAISENFSKKGCLIDLADYRKYYTNEAGHNIKLQLKAKDFCELAKYDPASQRCNLENLDFKLANLNKDDALSSSLQRKRFSSVSYHTFPDNIRHL